MIVKTTFNGPGMYKYGVFALITKLSMFVLFIIFGIIPYGTEFITILNESINTQVWDLMNLLKPLGIIILSFIITVVIESIIVFLLILPLAKKELYNRF